MSCLCLVISAAILDLHVHIDRPYVHTLGVVRHYALKHRAATFRLIEFILQGSEFSNDVDVLRLG